MRGRRCALGLALTAALVGCGSTLPARYVIERDLDGFAYRRYQKTLDVEIAVAGNEATGYTATYLRRGSDRQVAVATAFVTVYQKADSLAAEVRERLLALDRYHVALQELGGGYAFMLDAGPGERWAVWVSDRHVVKLGAPPGESIPDALIDAYTKLYPSDLDEHGRARPDASSRGPSQRERKAGGEQEQELPRYLRQNAPR
jgi:hypothetical protein